MLMKSIRPRNAAFARRFVRWQHSQKEGGSVYDHASQRAGSTPKEDLEVFKQSQRLRGMALGVLAIGGLIGGFQLYNNKNWVKSKIYGDNFDNESFDEMYNGLKEKKKQRSERVIANAQEVSNPNGSDVPGVYICGNNRYGLVSDSTEFDIVPLFKRLDVFDNFVVKDITISQKSGALINEKGDLYQWGKGFNGDSHIPTLKGFNLEKVQISNGVVYTLNSKGEVYCIPESQSVQNEKLNEINGWLGKSRVPYFKLETATPIKDISSGLEHLMLLDKDGQVSTCATGLPGTNLDKSHGQFGLPEFSQFDNPPQPNELHPVLLLNKYKNDSGEVENRNLVSIGAGNYSSLVCDDLGGIWAWGWNKYGIVGKPLNFDTEFISYPVKIDGLNNHFKRSELAKCIDLVVGGDTAFATVTVSDIYKLFEEKMKRGSKPPSVTAGDDKVKYFSWGHGLKGSLGLSPQMFIHFTNDPKEMKTLSQMEEYNETSGKMEPIKVDKWAIGYRHGAVLMENGDVMTWGDGTSGQLADGKRNRRGAPNNVPKLLEPRQTTETSQWNNRLQLHSTNNLKQEIIAGWDTTAIVYKRKL